MNKLPLLGATILLLASHAQAYLLINSNDISGTAYTYGLNFTDMTTPAKFYNDISTYSDVAIRQVGTGTAQVNSLQAQAGVTTGTAQYKFDFSNSKYRPNSMTITDSIKDVYSSTASSTITTAYSLDGTTWTNIRSVTTVGHTTDQSSAGTTAPISLSTLPATVYYRVTFQANTGAFLDGANQWNPQTASGGNAPFQVAFQVSPITVTPVTITPSNPSSVQAGVLAAYKAGDTTVVIPSGTYVFTATNTTYHLRWMAMKNLTIDATGCTFNFSTRGKRSMQFQDCSNITFKGSTMIRSTIPSSQGTVQAVASNRRSIDVLIDTGYPTDINSTYFTGLSHINVFDPTTRKIKPPELYMSGTAVPLVGNSVRFAISGSIPSVFPINVGDPVAWRGAVYPDLDLNSCGSMHIQGVTIKGGTGMCFRELCGNGGNTYTDCTITYPDTPSGATTAPLLASNADGMHSRSMRVGPTITNCHLEGMDDDGFALHGMYGLVYEAPAANVIIADARPDTGTIEFARPGDVLRFYDLNGSFQDEATVTAATILTSYTPSMGPPAGYGLFDGPTARYCRFTLDHNVSAAYSWLISNANTICSNFSISQSSTQNHRARGVLIKSCSGTISNCQITDVLQGGILVVPEQTSFNEADFGRQLTITGNTITRCGSARKSNYGAMTIGAYEHNQFVPLPAGYRDIVVSNNTFDHDDGVNLLVTSATNVQITGNVFTSPMNTAVYNGGAYGVPQGALVWLTQDQNIQISNNLVQSPGPLLTDNVVATASASGTGFTTGVVTLQKTEAQFIGGNTSMVVDGYPGMIGGGWLSIWGMISNVASVSPTVVNTTPLSTGGGNYLAVTMLSTTSSSSAGGVYRTLDTPPSGVDLTQPHQISFDFRPETVNTAARFVLYSRITAPWHTTDSSDTWSIQGTSTGWKYNNGDGVGGATLTNTTFTSLIANRTYHFTINVYPATKTWSFKISDGTTTYTSPTAGFRVNSTADGPHIHFGVTNSSTSSNTFNYSVDSIVVTNFIF
ncbi:hypothetical protein BH09VER1_BH09VER1_17660 [soil metagenome]